MWVEKPSTVPSINPRYILGLTQKPWMAHSFESLSPIEEKLGSQKEPSMEAEQVTQKDPVPFSAQR